VSYGEITAMAQRRGRLDELLEAAVNPEYQTPRLRIAISPHAPYSVEPEGYRRCLAEAKSRSLRLATHLAEMPQEAEFLAHHTGPFADLWQRMNAWDDKVPKFDGGPIRFAQSLGLLDYPTLLAHVNYCDDDELQILSRGRASVVYCPRTHQYFGHPPHRWRDMLTRGINVAVGTDSCASSPNLNLVDDLRLLHEIAPGVPAQEIWELATTRAAKALGLTGLTGEIREGISADLTAFVVKSHQPLLEILEKSAEPSQIWTEGKSNIIGTEDTEITEHTE